MAAGGAGRCPIRTGTGAHPSAATHASGVIQEISRFRRRRTTTTGTDGRYSFSVLPLSDATGYTVTETQPADYDTVGERPGSAGGTVPAPNRINVRLTA